MNAKNRIYFDYNATTPVHPEVVKIMDEFYLQKFGNAGSAHTFGLKAFEGVHWARKTCAEFLRGKPENIIFTSGGSEADNLALQGRLYKYKEEHPNSIPHLIITSIEHPAVFETAKFLENQGFKVTYLSVNKEGAVSAKQVQEAIREDTALISIMYANNEIGTINPIKEIGQVAKKAGIMLHTDAVQAFAKVKIDVQRENIDLLSVSAHKFYGPKGIGFLYVKNDDDMEKNASSAAKYLRPLMYGGSQEFNMRPATENVPGLVGMAKAVELAEKDFDLEYSRLVKLRDYLIDHILQEIPETKLNGSRTNRLPHNVNICFQNIYAYDLMIKLDAAGIACSVGAACHAGETKPSRVLLGIGLNSDEAAASLRFSLGRWTTQEHIDELLRLLEKYVTEMRKKA
ncbi:MAG: cysteine desulfurase [Candidatus Lokiarchaeota archaeon]|nr:cysteine desulfurase [Candidatus Harpocratesius repetitus]